MREILGLFDIPPFDIKDVLWWPFLKNCPQASFPSHLHFVKNLTQIAAIFLILKHIKDFLTISYGSHIIF